MTWDQWWKSMPEDLRASYGPQAIAATKHAWDAAQREAKEVLELVAAPIAIDGENHMADVKRARMFLGEKP